MPSPYASSLGRLKAHVVAFLPKELLLRLAEAKDSGEIAKALEPTAYGPALVQAASTLKGTPMLEVAVNRTFVERNRRAYESVPFSGKPAVGAYLRRWDIENIELILSAKAQNRPIVETEVFLVSSREIPAGMFAGTMTLDDFRLLLQQPSLEAVVSSLVRFGYGGVLLPLLDEYQRTHDIFPLRQALEREYYARLRETRFFQGDEWVIRQFVATDLDVRNVLILLKGKDSQVPSEIVESRLLEGGTIPLPQLRDAYAARDVPELANNLSPKFASIGEGLSAYKESRNLTGFDSALSRERAIAETKRLRAFPLALAMSFTYMLQSELERADLRRIIYARVYGFSPERIRDLLVLPRIP